MLSSGSPGEAAPRAPRLSRAQELALARRIERGDVAAKDRLVEANLGLVAAIAADYRGCGVPFADLVQEGSIGLIRAAERFDHRRGVRFSTYASWWIRQAVVRAIGDARAIRLPDHAQRRLRALRRASDALAQDGRRPTLELAASAAGISVADAARLQQVASVRSLDAPLAGGTRTLGDAIADEHKQDDEDPLVDAGRLRQAVAALPARQRVLVERSFGLDGRVPEELREIAGRIGMSTEGARQLRATALLRLRAAALGTEAVDRRAA